MTDIPNITNIEEMIKWWATAKRSLMPNAPFIFDEWLLEHGERFGPTIERPKGVHLGRKKQCYQNSFEAQARNEWFYTEGVVFRAGLPIELAHAWLSNRKGEVLDLTLRDQSPDDQYFGIPFKSDYVVEETIKHGYYGLFGNGIRYNEDVMTSVDKGRAWKKGER